MAPLRSSGLLVASFVTSILGCAQCSYVATAPQLSQLAPTYNSPQNAPMPYWNGWGGNIYNNRWNPNDPLINTGSVQSLNMTCSQLYSGGVSATPVVEGDMVYYPTWNGEFVALNYRTCTPVWEYNVTKLINSYGNQTAAQKKIIFQAARTSPALDGEILYFGTQVWALLVALNKTTGAEIAYAQINPHPYAVATMSPTVWDGKVFIGTSSREEAAARMISNFQCCSFIGNFAAFELDQSAKRFNVYWNVTTLPTTGNWSGGAVWGSQPSVDVSRQQVFIGTGNVYSLPPEYEACRIAVSNISLLQSGLAADPCVPPGVYQETILAIDVTTGFINWERQLSPLDAWTAACGWNGSIQHPTAQRLPALCTYSPGPDADFGMAPTFVPGSAYTPHGMDTLTFGQKNGDLFALEAQTGKVFWAIKTTPDGNIGGISWGIAVDEQSIYFTAINSNLVQWTLQPNGPTINGSAFGAASLLNGSILWETPSPNGTFSVSPPTVVNDVVFFAREDSGRTAASYLNTSGALIPVNKRTGAILADIPLGNIMRSGIAVVNGSVFLGTGYHPGYKGNGEIQIWSPSSSGCVGTMPPSYSGYSSRIRR